MTFCPPEPSSSFVAVPCPSGPTTPEFDVEQHLLCDIGPNGEVLGTALAVYEYNESTGAPIGPPTFVDPATGLPYVAQGVLQPCPGEVGCLAPLQFCFTSTTTGPVNHPGRQYDITLPINPGFAVDSLQIDAVNHPAGLTWSVLDVDGSQFAAALQTFIQNRFNSYPATVTVTNPNAGSPVCGTAAAMTIHIECVRLDTPAPNLVELVYNAGKDLVQNPAYLTTPPTDLSTVQFKYVNRQDSAGPNPTLNCTSVANRGWETNDLGDANRDFELWGTGPGGLQQLENATPTPRGTPIQEITADINDTGPGPTIWQTFNVPVAGNFIAQLVHGARDSGEQHTIKLSTGDTNDTGPGDIVNNVTTPAAVTLHGGPNPWTNFSQNVALAAGDYTFSFTTTNPVGANRGGLFTDMRVYLDAPGQRATAVNDDNTCVVTTQDTTTTKTCEYWAPLCVNGVIQDWHNVETGADLTNAAFWSAVPSPECCLPEAATPGGGSSVANLIYNYEICGLVGGVPTTLNHVVITDASGGVIAESIIGPGGAPVVPTSYTIGACQTGRTFVNDEILCDQAGPFLRKYVQSLSPTNQGQISSFSDWTLAGAPYSPVLPIAACGATQQMVRLCDDDGNQPLQAFYRIYSIDSTGIVTDFDDVSLTGNPYVLTGSATQCESDFEQEILCDVGAGNTKFIRVYQYLQNGAFSDFDDKDFNGAPYTVVGPVAVCPEPGNDVEQEVLCDDDGPFVRTYQYDTETGTLIGTTDLTLDGAPHIAVGTLGICSSIDFEEEILCDTNGPFIRRFIRNPDGLTTTTDFTLAGAAYVAVGPVGICPSAGNDVEQIVLCDSGASGLEFIRVYKYDTAGGLVGFSDFTFAGAPYVPVGTVEVCNGQVPRFQHEEILCDNNGPFLRKFIQDFNGVLIAVVNKDLEGIDYVPVGTVRTCSGCTETILRYACLASGTTPDTNNGFNFTTFPGCMYAPGANPTYVYGDKIISWEGTYDSSAASVSDFNLSAPELGGIVAANAGFSPAIPVFPGAAAGFTSTKVVNGITITYKVISGNGGRSSLAPTFFEGNGGDRIRISFSAPVTATIVTSSFGGANNERLCNVIVQRVLRSVTVTKSTCTGATHVYDATTGVELLGVDPNTIVDCTLVETATTATSQIDVEEEILCDNNGPFVRSYTYTDGVIGAPADFTLAGAPYVPVGTVILCPTTVTLTEFDIEIVTLCDDNGGFLRRFTYNETTGLPTTVITTDFAGNPYVPVGTVKVCDQTVAVTELDAEIQFMCDSNGPTTFLRRYLFNETTGAIGTILDFTLAGAAYVTVGTVTAGACTPAAGATVDVEEEILCDDNGGFIRRKSFNGSTGALISTADLNFAGAAYATVGTVRICSDPSFVVQEEVLCDNNGGFLRRFVFNGLTGALISTTNLTLAGTAYVPVGTVRACADTVTPQIDSEIQFMCDNGLTTFMRRYEWNEATGAFIVAGDFTLAGAAYVAAGPVTPGSCVTASPIDDVELIEHCDTLGNVHTTFYKRLVFDKNGVLLSTTNIDSAGNPYVVTGAVTVGSCSTCCPFNAGTGCTNTGSGTYVSVRNADGTFTLVDPVTGSTVLAANVVPCPATTISVAASTLDTTIARQTGAGNIVIAAGARSITLVVLLGAPTVAIPGSTTTAVPAGVTLTWAVDASSQTLLKAYTFTGIAGDDFIVTTTR